MGEAVLGEAVLVKRPGREAVVLEGLMAALLDELLEHEEDIVRIEVGEAALRWTGEKVHTRMTKSTRSKRYRKGGGR